MMKPTMKVDVSGLETCWFYWGYGMQNHWVENNNTFTNCVRKKIGQYVKVSILEGELVVTELDDKLIPKFKIEADK